MQCHACGVEQLEQTPFCTSCGARQEARAAPMEDYYQLLDVPPHASPEEIRQQWRLFVQAWHPDKFANPADKASAEEKTKGFNKAYEVLSDPAKRRAYDAQRQAEQTEEQRRQRAEAARRAREEQQRREQTASAAPPAKLWWWDISAARLASIVVGGVVLFAGMAWLLQPSTRQEPVSNQEVQEATKRVAEPITRPGWLGIYSQGVTLGMAQALGLAQAQGVRVDEVVPGGAAARAGIERGEVIVDVVGQAVEDPIALLDMIAQFAVGTQVNVGLIRRGSTQRVAVTLGELPEYVEYNKNGLKYEQGLGVAQDEAEAAKWYRTAADQGYVVAQYNLGRMYEKDTGEQKHSEAVKWYRKAADQDYAWGQFRLGVMYANGWGVAQDEAEAVKWYRKAADQSLATAQDKLGMMYEKGKNLNEAVKWYRQAADQGDAFGQFHLGVMYANGRGVVQDEAEAVKWYRKAADQGHEEAKKRVKIMAYGSKAGMQVTVVSTIGMDTANAVIRTQHTREDAIVYCREYVGKVTEQCIREELKRPPKKEIRANCLTGKFTDFYGGEYQFQGRNQDPNIGADYAIVDLTTGETANGSGASGYSVKMSLYQALCPTRAPRDSEWVELGKDAANCTYQYFEPVQRGEQGGLYYWRKRSCPTKQTEKIQGKTVAYFVEQSRVFLDCANERIVWKDIQYFDRNSGTPRDTFSPTDWDTLLTPSTADRPIVEKYCTSGGPSKWVMVAQRDPCIIQYLEPVVTLEKGFWIWTRITCTEELEIEDGNAPGGKIRFFTALGHIYFSCSRERKFESYGEFFDRNEKSIFSFTERNDRELPREAVDFEVNPDLGSLVGPDDIQRPIMNKYCR